MKDNAKDNATVEENRRAGTLEWQLRNVRFDDPVTLASFPLVRHLTSSAIQGYASKTSVYPGESIDIMVSMEPVGEFTVDFYRLGWYGGQGGRHMGQLGPLQGGTQPVPTMSVQRLRECTWEVSASLTIPDDWESGVYLAKIVSGGTLRCAELCDFRGEVAAQGGLAFPGERYHMAGLQQVAWE